MEFVLGICSYGEISDPTDASIVGLQEAGFNFKKLRRNHDALIGRSRSRVATEFMFEDYGDVLLFVDTDIVFTPDDVSTLLDATCWHNMATRIVAGGYIMKDGKNFANRGWEPMKPDGKIHDVEYVSTGFLAIPRWALEQIQKKLDLPLLHPGWGDKECYPFFESGRDRTGRHDFYMSEDWDFCDKAREAGLRVYWHTGVLVGHLKQVILAYNPKTSLEELGITNA